MEIYNQIAAFKVVPVITIEDAGKAVHLADALTEGGLPVAEITFRTAAAASVIDRIARERPDFVLGAGTILTVDQLKEAADYGARFGVAPGFNKKIVEAAQKTGFPFSPGIMTPSEIEAAMVMGLKVLKFFPAEASGGVKFLKSISAPYTHLGIRFIPTGGINTDNLQSYLDLPQVLAAGGSWIATSEDIRNGDWNRITARCRDLTS